MIRATVSGSFHRHMVQIYEAVGLLRSHGVDVLSPADPRVVDHIGEFLFVASDKLRSIKLVQDRHLEAIRQSDFLWVVCPDGYTGASTSGEIMAAHVMNVPVYGLVSALDVTIGQYVQVVENVTEAIRLSAKRSSRPQPRNVLLDPSAAVEDSLKVLDALKPALLGTSGNGSDDAERALERARTHLRSTFGA